MKLLPLSPLRFHILLSLSGSSAHARLIAHRISYDSFGELEPSPATLHDNLQYLLRCGWIEYGMGRSYYLTGNGRDILESDLYRWRIVTYRATETLKRA